MAEIVTLREKNIRELAEMLENAQEEMFNLRFQRASARLVDTSRLQKVRREIAQIRTVMNDRQRAIDAASEVDEIAAALDGQDWSADAHFDYEESAWLVSFEDEAENGLASAIVDLNRKQGQTRRQRAVGSANVVKSYELTG